VIPLFNEASRAGKRFFWREEHECDVSTRGTSRPAELLRTEYSEYSGVVPEYGVLQTPEYLVLRTPG
jgi:hypothetical protein